MTFGDDHGDHGEGQTDDGDGEDDLDDAEALETSLLVLLGQLPIGNGHLDGQADDGEGGDSDGDDGMVVLQLVLRRNTTDKINSSHKRAP